jgi:hypothetical protein
MFSDSLWHRCAAAWILGLSALLAVSMAVGCASGTSYGGGGGGGTPSLAAAVASTGKFSTGEQGASYTITVSNTGTAATSGTVTVADPPTGFTVTAISGPLWTCTLATTTCTNSYSLPPGQSFATITVTGNVTSASGTPVIIPLTLSGGGAPTVNVPPTSIAVPAPALSISKSHTGNFSQGQVGATYQVMVSSNARAGATDGSTVVVTDTPQAGLTVTAMAGTGWTRLGGAMANTVVRSDILQPGSSYPPITVTVNVSPVAASPQINSVTVTGGGSASRNASDSTTIVASTAPVCPLSKLGNESVLSGTYVVALNGWEDGGGPFQGIGAFAADGTGGVTNGELDSGIVAVGAAQSAPKLETVSGCYQVGLDFHGLMIWNLSGGGSETFTFVLSSDGTFGDIMEFDDQNPGASPGMRASGDFNIEAGGQFGLASFSGPFGFEAKGYAPNASNTDYLRERKIGRFDDSMAGVVTNGATDAGFGTSNGTQTNLDNQTFTGQFTAPDSLGRGTATFTYPNFNNAGQLILNFAYYLNDANDMVMVSTDTPDANGHALEHGFVTTQLNTPYSAASLNGNAVFYLIGGDLSANHNFTIAGAGRVTGDGIGGASVLLDEVSNGSVVATGTNTISGGSFTVSPNGMGVLTIGSGGTSQKFSVAMYDNNFGNMLEGTSSSPGSNVIIGEFRSQTAPAGGFVDGTFSGPYMIGTNRQASSSSTFEVGTVTTPTPQTTPLPSFSGTIDSSNGAGCITNCLTANQPVSATFSVDANGRFTITPTSGGGGPAIGWFRNKGNGFWIISDTSDKNASILN